MEGSGIERLVVEMAEQQRSQFYGKYRGVVSDINDPDNMGRIRASVPEVLGNTESPWALPCAPWSGDGMGAYSIPPVGAGVWIEFEAGDPSRPVWTGCWWSKDQLPKDEDGTPATPAVKIMRTESGMMLSMNDDDLSISLSDKNAANILKININQGEITLQGKLKAVVEAPKIELVKNSTHPVVFGDELLTYLSQLVQMYQTHTHPGETVFGIPVTPAPPVPPMPVPTPALVSKKVTTG
ncbi:VgrG protein [hydrothermal vent metagenome]|uniref:VgrG protein n=1 Tax=hydrothermal vent metagenome TaxID=652676 RepID=A0A3B0XMZ7_9ZZZZ